MRGLRVREEMLAGVAADGTVTVEGHFVGRLAGVSFESAQGASLLEEKALRAAAQHAVGPEIARRLGQLAAEPDTAFALTPDGAVLWRGEVAGVLAGGGEAFLPAGVRLLGEIGQESYSASGPSSGWRGLRGRRGRAPAGRPAQARGGGGRGQGRRGLPGAWPSGLTEAGGVLDRALVRGEVRSLSQVERRVLRGLGVKLGAFSVYLPGLLQPEARVLTEALSAARLLAGDRRSTGLATLPAPAPSPACWPPLACAPSAAWPCRWSNLSGWTSSCAPASNRVAGSCSPEEMRAASAGATTRRARS